MSKQNARERIQQRRGQQKRQTQLILIGAIALVALILVGILIAFNLPQQSTPPAVGNYQGIPESIDTSGAIGLSIGQDKAPNTMIEYSDFSCPHCHDIVEPVHQLIAQYVKPGVLRIVYKPVTFVGGAYSEAAARGAICAARQGKFWEMQDQIWGLFASRSAGAYNETAMATLAATVGLDADKFNTCYNATDTTTAILSVSNEVQTIGVNSTPTIFLNGQRLDFGGPEGLVSAVAAKLGTAPAVAPVEPSPTP